MMRFLGVIGLVITLFASTPSSRADLITYVANLDGPSESPANASPGTGFGQVDFDIVTHFMRVQVSFAGLLGTTTASHIHSATTTPGSGTAGVATQTPTFTGFPSGVTSGTYDHTFDTSLASTWNPAFITANGGTPAGAESALASGLATGRAYLNIHSTVFPTGEIRGFLQPLAVVPEPSSLVLVAFGTLGLGIAGFGRRSKAQTGRS